LQEDSIGGWLDELASSAPAPGGGAAAALEAAMGAALVEMVCNLTIGKPAYAEHEEAMTAARDRAGLRRAESLALVAEDEDAFRAVIAAYKLPKETEAEAAERTARIQAALAGAADVPRRTAVAAAEVVDLAASIVAGSNPNVVSDVAAAAASARAALATALVNIEVNAGSIADPDLKASLAGAARQIERDLERADAVVASVRERLAG
jgi:methenyltetrahydrofolate cyclohydrolase